MVFREKPKIFGRPKIFGFPVVQVRGVQEHAALLAVSLEQASLDSGRWDLAGQLLLLEEPSAQVWSHRGVSSQSGRARAFAPLCPQRWATIAIAYSKEIDYIHNRRQELSKKNNPADPALAPIPKKKGQQHRAKGGGDGGTSQSSGG